MKRFLVAIFILIPLGLSAQLQVRYIKGTITTTDSTTITAFVKGLSLASLNSGIYYKTNPETREQEKIEPGLLQKVNLENGEQYERLTFADPEFKQPVTSVGRVLVRGSLTLYQTISGSTTYFVVRSTTDTYVLREDKISSGRLDHFYFKNLLAAATSDKPEMNLRAQRMRFGEKEIARFVADYNMLKTGESTTLNVAYQKAKFLMVFANGAVSKDRDIFLQATARFYAVKFSHSLSLNVGVHYFNYSMTEPDHYSPNGITTLYTNVVHGSVFSVPVYAQENLLSGRFRPFVFGGVNISTSSQTDDNHHLQQVKGFQKSYGFNYLVGAGIEWNITHQLMVKTEWIHEYIDHPIFVGIGYCLGK